ncbi:MAG TPA: hypothetical protein VF109_05010 [Mycobacteriales bacterium]
MPRHKLWSDDEPDDLPSYASSNEPQWLFPDAPPEYDVSDDPVAGGGDRWSTWDLSTAGEHGPAPYPDVVGNPQGPAYLDRDARNVAAWVSRRGRPVDAEALVGTLRHEARAR